VVLQRLKKAKIKSFAVAAVEKFSILLRLTAVLNSILGDTNFRDKSSLSLKAREETEAELFCLVGFFGAGVTAILLFAVKGHVDFFTNWTFLIQSDPSALTMQT
jgi:hypothetical protein